MKNSREKALCESSGKRFADFFPFSVGSRRIDHLSPEALAELPYPQELELKNRALAAFLHDADLPAPAPVVPAPLARAYRSTGKRRVSCRGGKVFFHLGRTPGKEEVAASALEPAENMALYRFVRQNLALPRSREAAEAMNYCILRGTGNDRTMIFNVRELSGGVIRTLRSLAEAAAKEFPAFRSAFLYVDESGSDYYLEAERPEGKLGWKKFFGPEQLSLHLALPEPFKLLYPPTVFSQINESILPAFASALAENLQPQKNDQLLDLYCGYGLWSLVLAPRVGKIWGAELSREAVGAARANAAYHFPAQPIRFESGFIDGNFLREKLPEPRREREIVLLDPPRSGALPGVPETLIGRRPRMIAHVFCGVDEIPGAMKIYRANGCRVKALRPFDFFPGTLNLEVLALIEPPQSK